MKKLLLFLLLISVLCAPRSAFATPFFVQMFQSDGSANSSQIGVSAWPQTDSPFTVYGTNIIYGGNIETVVLNGSGYGTNWLFPGTYRFYITNLNAAFVAVIPDTLVTNSISLYITNVPVFSGVSLNSYQVLTNLLGFAPATNSFIGLTNALKFFPATNSAAGIDFALGYIPRTNDGYIGVTNLPAPANIVTNGFSVWVAYKTNGVPGSAFTNLPTGALMTTTNGGFYVLSNLVWNPK